MADVTIPFATSHITISRSTISDLDDPYDPVSVFPPTTTVTVANGIRAVIAPPTVNENLTIGERQVYEARLICDTCDLRESDTVTDSYGRQWVALGPSPWGAFFLSGMQATLRLTESFAQ